MAGMKFAKIVHTPCRVDPGASTPCDPDGDGTPNTPTPPTDERCADPSFRKANPGLCENFPYLVIKPAVFSLCALQVRKFRVFLYANNTEVELTTGVQWHSSNQLTALVGVSSGKVTGLAEGIVTISASWQDLMAHAQVTVLPENCCSDAKVGVVLVVDNSLSMTSAFNAVYSTKLSLAKSLAYKFVSELNATKDVISLMTFNEAGNEVVPFTDDIAALKVAVTAIVSTQKSTNLGDALGDAIKILDDDTTITRKVIVLLTDGWNHQGDDPIQIADEFEEAGGIIQVVGIRAFGDGFKLLNEVATGGFFINAHSGSYKDVPAQMSGLKGYYCAGNCVPPGDVTINRAALMWGTAVGAFAKWDVTKGAVDLIGGTPPYDLYDLLPGNGLYLDLAGSAPWPFPPDPTGVWMGKIVSKSEFDFSGGTTYRLAFRMAGNQREATPSGSHYRVRVKVEGDSGVLLNEVITIDDYAQDFTDYSFDFTGPGGGKISFEQIEQANVAAFGLLLDDVQLIEDPDGSAEVRFEDDFDDENSVYVPPKCGASFVAGQGYGYDCYGYGCLSEPLGVQTEDPLPLPDDLEDAGIADGGGGGGGGESATYFNPAGIYPTITYVDQQLALILQQAKDYADSLMGDIDLSPYLPKTGGTMTGFITLHAPPTDDLHAATKAYVDDAIETVDLSDYLPLAGGTMLGPITLPGAPTDDLHAATKLYVDSTVAGVDLSDYVLKAGDTMTGPLLLPPGTSGAPSLSFAGDTDTGFYGLTDYVAMSSAGAPQWLSGGGIFQLGSTMQFGWASGAIYSTATDVALYRDAANTLALRNGAASQAFNLYYTYTDSSNYVRLITTGNDGVGGFGIYTQGAGSGAAGRHLSIGTLQSQAIHFVTNGGLRWDITGDGHLLTVADNTYDIGASGATRPRSGYFGTSIYVPTIFSPGILGLFAGAGQTLVLGNSSIGNIWQIGGTGHFTAATDNSYDIGANNATRPRSIYAGTSVRAPEWYFTSGASTHLRMQATADGVFQIRNGGGTDFGRMMLGGSSSSFPAIKRSGASVEFVLADNSAAAAISALRLALSDGSGATPSLAFGTMGISADATGVFIANSGVSRIRFNYNSLELGSLDYLGWSSSATGFAFGSGDTRLYRDAANVLAQRNSTNAQAFRVYNTYTDASNYERAFVRWASNILEIGGEAAGTGSGRTTRIQSAAALRFGTAGADKWAIDTTGNLLAFGADNTYDIGASGATRPRHGYFAGQITADAALVTQYVFGISKGGFYFISDGVIRASNNAGTDFSRLQLGGTTSSFPAIKRNGAGIDFRLADDSAYAGIASSYLSTSGQVVAGSFVQVGATWQLLWTGRTQILSPADGQLLMYNAAGNGFTSLSLYDVVLNRKAADHLELRRSTNAQQLSIAHTWTDASNNEYGYLKANSGGPFEIGTVKAGTGTARSLLLKPETGLIQLFDTTSAAPAWKRNSMNVELVLADDSGYSGMRVGALHTQSLTVDEVGAAPVAGGSAPSFADFYGSQDFALGEPDGWLSIDHAGSTRKVPYYN